MTLPFIPCCIQQSETLQPKSSHVMRNEKLTNEYIALDAKKCFKRNWNGFILSVRLMVLFGVYLEKLQQFWIYCSSTHAYFELVTCLMRKSMHLKFYFPLTQHPTTDFEHNIRFTVLNINNLNKYTNSRGKLEMIFGRSNNHLFYFHNKAVR